ncbi:MULTISPECIES: tape measure protein [Enterobacter]|uniref:tape measure protein n=1 Tax=Enterobacter TaxID=547 RepID=UPI000799452B|nr:tape measure protein [Enterobacter hormaechei]MCU3687606.1 tape measure protein [Enterobacter hormaechei subsp. steigerwaltii]MBK4255118.1 tape measure protein [Enterobacter hormaechei]MBK4443113.1 tape measure protein [Enterobacter hormaechei]MBK4449121.1 tape measure protein [Enterobacter hormaechei]MBK4511346.1 tape measure protein [Enterobacter hormaechei]
MAGTVSAGTIVYEVDMDTAGILQGRRDIDAALNGLNGSMGRLEAGLNRTERSLSSIEGTMSSLTGVAKALIAALSVQQVGAYAQAWQDLSNKLANAVRDSVPPFETLADVTERVFDISQKTRSGLDATATLYARLERSTRSYGVSVEDITRLTTIINQGFVVSGSTAEEASNAIIQLAQGLASGALRGDEFNSVNEQGNRLMIALADSMNVSIGALRNMAAEGKLTTDVIVNGLLSQGDKIGQEFAKTTATISQSLEIANNNITKFFGENATVKTGVKIFSDSVISLSENLDVLSATLTIVAGVMGARYVGALTMATSAKIADIAASRQQVVADNQTAQAALVAANSVQRKALADKEAALSSLALAQAEYNVAKGSAAEMLAMDALVAAKTRATTASLALAQAETAQAAASARAATAARAASVGIGMARGALALIGGPAGAAMLAAGAIFYFWQKAQQAKEEAIAFADGLDKLNAAMNAMSNTQLRGAIADANNSIRAQKEAVADLQSEVDSLRDRYQNFTPAAQKVAESMGQGTDFARQQAEVSDELARKTRDLEAAKDKLSRTEEIASEATRTLTNNMLTAMGVHDQLIEKSWSLEQVQGAVAKAFGETADEINRANQAGKSFDPKALQISPATKDGDKVIATLEEQNELLKIQDERERAIAKARMQAAKVTDNQNQISAAGRLAAENYDLEKSEEARKKSQQESERQGKKSASSAESVAQKLANLKQQSELAADSTEELSREQAILRAQQSLGNSATQEQIKKAGEYAAKAWDASAAAKGVTEALKAMPLQAENKSYAESMQNLKAALNAGKIDLKEYNAATEKMALEHQNNLAKINAQATVNPVASARAEVDPVQQLVNENNQKLALMQQYQQQEQAILQQSYQKGKINYDQFVAAKAATDAQYLALKTAQENQFNEQMTAAQWQLLSQQGLGYEMLTSAVDAFSGNASNALTGLITGTMSAQDAMRSLGNTMLNSVVNALVQVGVEALKNFIIGQTLGAAATAAGASQAAILATAWAPAAAMASLASFGANSVPAMTGIASTVGLAQGLALTGMRYNGGPVNAGGLYQVGERGKPEIYQASTGKQYMIPGDNGRVISNKDMTAGGGGIQVSVIFNDMSSGQHMYDARATQAGNTLTVEAFVADMNNGGIMSQAITGNTTAKRTPRGQG